MRNTDIDYEFNGMTDMPTRRAMYPERREFQTVLSDERPKEASKRTHILLIGCCSTLEQSFGNSEHEAHWSVESCADGQTALEHMRVSAFDSVFVDIDRVDLYGPSLIADLKLVSGNAKVVVIANPVHPEFVAQLERAGADVIVPAANAPDAEFYSSELTMLQSHRQIA